MFHPARSKIRTAPLWLGFLLLIAPLPASAHDYRFFKSDGSSIAYTDYGSGVPVIFLHGLGGTYESHLGRTGDVLSKEFRVLGVDQRGFGRSDKPHDGDAYGEHMANDVLNLMDRLQIRKAHLVGHSMGGIVAMYLVARHPERFHSGVTIGNGLFSRRELTLIGWLIRGISAWERTKAFFGAAGKPQTGSDPVAAVLAARNLKDLAVTEQQAAALKLPLLGMRGGEEDDPNDTVERLVTINPSVEMIRIESEDHISLLTREAFTQGLREFLLRHNTFEQSRIGK
ncbi:MAG TPA: alpha/beta fold hydrolase [Solimonas sp.]|nr:alpha/beta fold hydrolase [Solimonas sp.]